MFCNAQLFNVLLYQNLNIESITFVKDQGLDLGLWLREGITYVDTQTRDSFYANRNQHREGWIESALGAEEVRCKGTHNLL